jgi:hypothetical protein
MGIAGRFGLHLIPLKQEEIDAKKAEIRQRRYDDIQDKIYGSGRDWKARHMPPKVAYAYENSSLHKVMFPFL